jgi:hypothetical protein
MHDPALICRHETRAVLGEVGEVCPIRNGGESPFLRFFTEDCGRPHTAVVAAIPWIFQKMGIIKNRKRVHATYKAVAFCGCNGSFHLPAGNEGACEEQTPCFFTEDFVCDNCQEAAVHTAGISDEQ